MALEVTERVEQVSLRFAGSAESAQAPAAIEEHVAFEVDESRFLVEVLGLGESGEGSLRGMPDLDGAEDGQDPGAHMALEIAILDASAFLSALCSRTGRRSCAPALVKQALPAIALGETDRVVTHEREVLGLKRQTSGNDPAFPLLGLPRQGSRG